MLYSSSSYTAANTYGDSAHYLKNQLRNIAVGSFAMFVFARTDYHRWRRWGFLAYLGAFLLCVLVMFNIPGITVSSHGQSRWINLFVFQLQPSELGKLAVILFLAMLLERIPKQMAKFSSVVKIVVILVPLLGVVAYSNLSTALIIFGIAVCMLFVASPRYLQFVLVGGGGAAFAVAFIVLAGYRGERITAWLDPEAAGDAGYQTMQALYAIGSGKLFGKGLGQSLQKLGNVPEAQNDMIFSIICEELGLFGAVCVILLFMLLLWRMMVIANNATDLYGALLMVGIMSHMAIQVILNIGVVTNTIPNTGVTLPFISYGGTSLVFLMAEMGLALSVSKGIRLETIG
jgi:cell division protein FtsW